MRAKQAAEEAHMLPVVSGHGMGTRASDKAFLARIKRDFGLDLTL
jgi:hypothetical protein